MEHSLDYWKIKNYLTAHEAACLAIGIDPGKVGLANAKSQHEAPNGWRAVYDEIRNNTEDFRQHADASREELLLQVREGLFDMDAPRPDGSEVIFNSDFKYPDIKRNEKGLYGPGEDELDQYMIKQKAIKQWIIEIGLPSKYFNPNNENLILPPRQQPEYQTRLMEIMYETMEKYWTHYDPDERDTAPTQKYIVAQLEEDYSLSGRQAEAVEILARPDSARDPQGKK